jgi:REP element-mobilizing transposase RayT
MSQSLSAIYVHMIFSTKDRRPFLTDVPLRQELHAYLAAILKNHECPPVLVGGPTDHVHALFLLSRTDTLADMIAEVKRSSSIWIKTKERDLNAFQWQSGYGAFSVSHSHVGRVCKYIEGQEPHHVRVSFQDEFRLFLRRHNIEFDERYVWD